MKLKWPTGLGVSSDIRKPPLQKIEPGFWEAINCTTLPHKVQFARGNVAGCDVLRAPLRNPRIVRLRWHGERCARCLAVFHALELQYCRVPLQFHGSKRSAFRLFSRCLPLMSQPFCRLARPAIPFEG